MAAIRMGMGSDHVMDSGSDVAPIDSPHGSDTHKALERVRWEQRDGDPAACPLATTGSRLGAVSPHEADKRPWQWRWATVSSLGGKVGGDPHMVGSRISQSRFFVHRVARMPVIYLDTIDDPKLAVYRDLKSPAAKRRSERFVVEGQLLAERLLTSGLRVESVLVEERLADEWSPLLPAGVPLLVIPRLWVRELIGFRFHRGVLACGLRPPNADLRQLMQSAGDKSTWVACVGVQDPENLGGIMRSGAAFGVHALLLGPDCADPFSRRVARTSMGANFRLPLFESEDLTRDLTAHTRRARRPTRGHRAGGRCRTVIGGRTVQSHGLAVRQRRVRIGAAVAGALRSPRDDPHAARGRFVERQRGGRDLSVPLARRPRNIRRDVTSSAQALTGTSAEVQRA